MPTFLVKKNYNEGFRGVYFLGIREESFRLNLVLESKVRQSPTQFQAAVPCLVTQHSLRDKSKNGCMRDCIKEGAKAVFILANHNGGVNRMNLSKCDGVPQARERGKTRLCEVL